MPKPIKKNTRYMPGMDGLRALAVLAVIAYHLNLGFAPGGLLGVGVFFVLSGYLITDLLITEWVQTKRIDLKGFWMRRVRRLVPALILILVMVSIWVSAFMPSELPALKGDILAAALYVSNWWFVFHHVSYFASFGPPSPLGHLWSLAVEEQFYIVWPLLLLAGLLFIRKRGRIFALILLGALASALAMAMLYQPGTDPSRVYYGTDTRAFALLIGAALAVVWPSRKLNVAISKGALAVVDLVGITGLITILYMMWQTSEYDTFLYRGGLVILSAATACVVVAVAHPASRLGKLLGVKPLRWIGVRSYGIYLWHFPVIILTSPVVNTDGLNVSRAALQVVVSILLAALSWRFVEDPIRRGKMPWKSNQKKKWQKTKLAASISVVCTLGFLYAGMAAPTHEALASYTPHVNNINPDTQAPTGQNEMQGKNQSQNSSQNNNQSQNHNQSQSKTPASQKTGTQVQSAAASGSAKTSTSTRPKQQTSSSTSATSGVKHQSVTAIGDSVMLDIAPDLKKLVPGIVIDGHVGRQMYQAYSVVSQLQAEGELGHTVIIELGTNGPFTKSQLTSLLNYLGHNRHIILVNTRVPRSWQNTVNETLNEVVPSYPNTTLINWYAASAGHNEYFYQDGVHLNSVGSRVYAALVANAIH
jgi:peptidoglycan/LPS O-acetylase OafA/YrhL